MMTQTITAQGPVQVACSAVNGAAAKKGFLWGALLIFPVGFLCAIMGAAAKAAYPGMNATLALPQMIMNLDPIMSGLTLAALWAADVSTACHILLAAGTLFSQDIYKRFFNPSIIDFGGEYLLSVKKIIERAVVAAGRQGLVEANHVGEGAVAGAIHAALEQITPKAVGLNVGGRLELLAMGSIFV